MLNTDIINELSEHIVIRISTCMDDFLPGSWSETKTHADYDMWVITKGRVRIEIDGVTQFAAKDDIVLFCPDLQYSAYGCGEDCELIFSHFSFDIGNNRRILNEFSLPIIVGGKSLSQEIRLFKSQFSRYSKKLPLSSLMLKGCFIILLGKVLSQCAVSDPSVQYFRQNPVKDFGGKLKQLQPILAYMEKNIERPVSISELASIAGMSEKYFISYFKNTLGITPGNYIKQLKMNRARDFLVTRELSIKEISTQLGYPDQYTFSKAFKKYFKISPSRFIH